MNTRSMSAVQAPQAVVLATFARSRGGVWRHMRDLGRGLRDMGWSVVFALPSDATGPIADSAEDQIATIDVRRLASSLSRSDFPRLIHVHLADTFDVAALRLALQIRVSRRQLVITEHLPRTNASDHTLTGGNASRQTRAIKFAFKRLEYAAATRVIAVSNASQRFICTRYRLRSAKIVSIANGVALPPDPSSKEHAASDGPVRFVMAGSLILQKGADVLVAATQLSSEDWVVDVLGEGAHRAQLDRQVLDAGDSTRRRITFRGWSPDVANALSSADAVVVPSRWEASSYTALEAMAAGLPVIAARVDGVDDILVGPRQSIDEPGATGLFVPAEDPVALAAAMDRLSRNQSARRRMGTAGRRRVADYFTVEQMVHATAEVLTDVSARRGWPDAEADP